MSDLWIGVEAGAVPLDRIYSLVITKDRGGYAIRANLMASPLKTKANPGLVVVGGFATDEDATLCLSDLLERIRTSLVEPLYPDELPPWVAKETGAHPS